MAAPSTADREGRDPAHAAAGALRPGRRGRVPRQGAKKFTDKTGVEIKVDFVGWEDINQQTAVTSNSGAGPDIIIGFGDAPHIYIDKLIELTDVADYLDKRYGGWLALRKTLRYAVQDRRGWIGLPFGASGGPLVYRKSLVNAAGFDKVPEDHAGILELCKKLKAAGKPAGFALGNAVGDGNGFANWLLWSHNAALLDEEGNIIINSKETIAALKYLKELYPTFIAGTPSWNDVSNNRAYSSQEIGADRQRRLAVLLAEERSRDQGGGRRHRAPVPAQGLASTSPMSGLTLNAMVFKHSPYPNAAKAFLQFMLEKEQYEPWLNANSGYWSQPLAAYADAAVWSGDPKVAIFRETMKSPYYERLQGTDLDCDRRRHRRLRAGADVRLCRDRRGHARGRRRGGRAARQAVLPAAEPVASNRAAVIARSDSDEAIRS